MPNLRNRFPARRRFLKQSAALTASASLAAPILAVAQPATPGNKAPTPEAPSAAAAPAPPFRAVRSTRTADGGSSR